MALRYFPATPKQANVWFSWGVMHVTSKVSFDLPSAAISVLLPLHCTPVQ